jgi:cobalt/nickel transport system permease protein
MALAFEPPPAPSLLRELDPRWKLAVFTVATLVATVLRTLPAAALALAAALLLAFAARLPWPWFRNRVLGVLPLLALLVVPLPFLLPATDHVWAWGPLHVSGRGLTLALLVACKVLALLTLLLVLLATAPLDATLKAAHALHLPGLLVQLALLSYRYVFLLADELRRLRIALRVRGFRGRVDRHSYRTLGHVTGTLLVRGYERAERVGQAMRCRGFDGRFRSLTEFRTRARDVLAFALAASLALAVGLLDWLLF